MELTVHGDAWNMQMTDSGMHITLWQTGDTPIFAEFLIADIRKSAEFFCIATCKDTEHPMYKLFTDIFVGAKVC